MLAYGGRCSIHLQVEAVRCHTCRVTLRRFWRKAGLRAARKVGRSSLAVAVVGWGGAEKEGSRYVPGNTLMILARVGLRAGEHLTLYDSGASRITCRVTL